MKKLMIGLVGALAMVASAEVASSNIVGFQNNNSGADNNFVAVPFNVVGGYNTADIQQIQISDEGAGSIGWGTEVFSIWEGAPTVKEGTTFFYYDMSMDMSGTVTDPYFWGDDGFNPVSCVIAMGQGVTLSLADGLTISYAGEVSNEDVEFTSVEGNNFVGNSFAKEIDIQSIAISDGGSGNLGWGTEVFSIWEGAPTVKDGSTFFYYDASMDLSGTVTEPYFWGNDSFEPITYPIPAGQGFVLSLTSDLTVSIPSPY